MAVDRSVPAMRATLIALVIGFASVAAALTPQEQVLTPQQEARYRSFIHELRCLVCQNQTIADSNAELAGDLRNQVHALIAAGQTDAEIHRYVTDRYGDFVLYKPPLSWRTLMLWAGPFLLLLGALVFAFRLMRRRTVVADTAPVDRKQLNRLLDEER
ncbi:MAG: cytochrome c-type biogenesis protein [Panacagrimonas sp.]